MGEVEISARAYVKMSLHAARYPHAAVNGLLLAPAPRSGECLCLTDCVPLFHSHLALSVMLEVALNQVPPPDAHRPSRNPLTPLAQAHPWSLGSNAHPQGGRHDLVTDGPFPMAGGCVGRAGRAGSGRVLPCQCSFGRPEVSGVARGRRLRVMGWGGVKRTSLGHSFHLPFIQGLGTVKQALGCVRSEEIERNVFFWRS